MWTGSRSLCIWWVQPEKAHFVSSFFGSKVSSLRVKRGRAGRQSLATEYLCTYLPSPVTFWGRAARPCFWTGKLPGYLPGQQSSEIEGSNEGSGEMYLTLVVLHALCCSPNEASEPSSLFDSSSDILLAVLYLEEHRVLKLTVHHGEPGPSH